MAEKEPVPTPEKNRLRDVIVEAGPGHWPGTSAVDLSKNVRDRIAGGALYVAIDSNKYNLQYVSQGAVAPMSLEEFLDSDWLENTVQTLIIGNVVGEWSVRSVDTNFEPLLPGLHRKLTQGGTVLLIENLTPLISDHLKHIPYEQYGFTVRIYTDAKRYKNKLRRLRMRESPNAGFLFGQPFIIELKRKT